jgi:hypothetical protein
VIDVNKKKVQDGRENKTSWPIEKFWKLHFVVREITGKKTNGQLPFLFGYIYRLADGIIEKVRKDVVPLKP